MTFEEGMKRLDEIVRRMEDTELGLDESLRLFEEGVRLSRICSKRLDEAEHKIEQLLEGKDGRPCVAPVEESQG
ncbi:MAG: exodeoxyribonuclease VII small subunit [Ignavibacteriales bacterium]